MHAQTRAALSDGLVIPACPLALNRHRTFDERRQRALLRYYVAAGAGGIAVGVHTTQFAIRQPQHGLWEPLLRLAAAEMDRADQGRQVPLVRIGGVCGETSQAVREASLLRDLGYHAGLLSLAALKTASVAELLDHCRRVADVLPVFGFYLQPAVGGRPLSGQFWAGFLEIENIVGIKIAPFDRYQTLEVMRAAAESGRTDVALYTGNDDNIALDLVTPYRFRVGQRVVERRMVGGLLGHWAVWTRSAVQLLQDCHEVAKAGAPMSPEFLRRAMEITDCNAAFFDAANGYAGCIAGLHEVLRRQGLLEGTWCLDPAEGLSPGQAEAIDRVWQSYPHLNDDSFVAAGLDAWLRD